MRENLSMSGPDLVTIDRRAFLGGLVSSALTVPLAAEAQQAGKVPRVGVAYVEGQTIALDVRWAEGKTGWLPALAKDLVISRPDVIVTAGTEAIRATQQATRTLPIVMATVADPVRLGLATSLARPGANLTGLA